MKAVICKQWGPPQDLTIEDIADPIPGPGQVLVDVHAAGVSFPDFLMVQGLYQFKPEFPFSPGSEVAGVIAEVGDGVENWRVGDRVLCLAGHGGFAEKVLVGDTDLRPLPETMNFETAAGFMMNYGTSYHALVQRAQLQRGETLLVTGAAGGVGITAVELGKVLGARVIAAASTEEKLQAARAAGADELVNYGDGQLKDKVKALTDGQGADVIYDPVGGDIFLQCLRCINWRGRVLVVGFTSGDIPKVPANLILLKGCQVVGVFWGAAARREPEVNTRNFEELFKLHTEGAIKPLVSQTFPLEQTVDALMTLGERRAIGKVVIKVR